MAKKNPKTIKTAISVEQQAGTCELVVMTVNNDGHSTMHCSYEFGVQNYCTSMVRWQ